MSQPTESSHVYCGWYEQAGQKQLMTIRLTIGQGQIHGTGNDVLGPFSIHGTVVDESTQFAKTYATHLVDYSGTINGKVMSGTWTIISPRGVVHAGAFRIWRDSKSCSNQEADGEASMASPGADQGEREKPRCSSRKPERPFIPTHNSPAVACSDDGPGQHPSSNAGSKMIRLIMSARPCWNDLPCTILPLTESAGQLQEVVRAR